MTNEKKGVVCFNLEAAFEYFIYILCSGTYLAKLTASLGIPDSITGILTSFLSLGSTFQFFTSFIFKGNKVKVKCTVMQIIGDCCFLLLYVVPLLDLDYNLSVVLFTVLLLLGNILIKVPFSPKTSFFYSLIGTERKGILTANKEIISLFSGMAFTFLASKVIDKFDLAGEIKTAFLIFAFVLLIISVLHTMSMVVPKEIAKDEPTEKKKNPLYVLKDKYVLKIIVIDIFYTVAVNVSIPFFGSYQTKELMFSMTFISVLNIVSSVARALISRYFGRLGDKKSFRFLLIICLSIISLSFLINSFTIPKNAKILFSVYSVLHAISQAGINGAKTNLVYDYFDGEKARDVVSMQFAIDGLLGFLATAVFGILLDKIQKNGNTFLGLNVYAQQVLSFISFVLLVLLLLYTIFILPKRKEASNGAFTKGFFPPETDKKK